VHFERKIVLTAVAAVLPVAIAALLLAWTGDFSAKARWTVAFAVAVAFFLATWVMHEQLTYPIRTVSNLITALREEDYSLRGRRVDRNDVLGEVMIELNALAELMESRKLEAVEAAALLRAVLAQIDAAIFTFDDRGALRLVNPAAQRLLNLPAERMIGLTAAQLGLEELLADDVQTVDRSFGGRSGRWDVRQAAFRERGVPHRMLVISDITRALREEEVEAWRRIVRVLGHELNNSLAPIKSITASLERLVNRDTLPPDWREDIASGMRVIGSRTESLTRFTRAYAQLARVPDPQPRPTAIHELVVRVAALESRVPVRCSGGPLHASVDPDQLEQVLVNLLRNAADAALDEGSSVSVEWFARARTITIRVIDDGPGVGGTSNLFVPFFTTKAHGSGIGLFLSRQIAEAHGGTLWLEDRTDQHGAVATLTLPQ
jgi:two-component system nitrogen regulation sensor histidine kinase NtrY